MTPAARKTYGLSITILALSLIHFYIAYQFIRTSPGGFNIGAVMFTVLGLAQASLGIFGLLAARGK